MTAEADALRLSECLQELFKTQIAKNALFSTKGEMFILGYLYGKSSFATPGEISGAMNVSSARIAALLNALEGRGLVRRNVDPTDRRRVDVQLTDEGREILRAHQEKIYARLRKLAIELGEEDLREYIRLTMLIIKISQDSLEKE